MNIYTYVVNHGAESPRISALSVINGGTLIGVMFDDALMRLDAAEELINTLREMTTCNETRDAIDGYFENYMARRETA